MRRARYARHAAPRLPVGKLGPWRNLAIGPFGNVTLQLAQHGLSQLEPSAKAPWTRMMDLGGFVAGAAVRAGAARTSKPTATTASFRSSNSS
jgi:hypothetical protein